MASVTFVGDDLVTLGSWIGVYGGLGVKAPHIDTLADGVAFAGIGINSFTFSAVSADTRAIEQSGTTDRVSNCFFTNSGLPAPFTLTFSDSTPRRVAVYCCENIVADNGRANRIDVSPNSDGSSPTSYVYGDISPGIWSIWEVVDFARFSVQRIAGPNSIFNFIAVDSVPSSGNPTGNLLNNTRQLRHAL